MKTIVIAALWLVATLAPAMAIENVAFPSNDADVTKAAPTVLQGLLRRPEGDGPFPAVVVLHGCGGIYQRNGKLIARDDDWSERLRALGYVVLQVDSFTARGVREVCTMKDRPLTAERDRPRDAYGALRYLQSQSFVRPDRVALLGWSNGGIALLWTIAGTSTARPKTLEHDFAAAVAFYPGCSTALRAKRPWSTDVPLLMLLAEKDDWTPATNCQQLAERARGSGPAIETVVYPDAHHDFDAPNTPVRVRRDVATTRSGTATVGTNPAARADAITRVPRFLLERLPAK
ncbi:MAG: dienelactone hydrolase family protein [Alphaproteobacteria bacterium]|nr:dienelactone hydrolase family protein [Alphaproteobacteria bacterium]